MQNTKSILALGFCLDPSQWSLEYNDTAPTGEDTWLDFTVSACGHKPLHHHHITTIIGAI